MEEYLHLVTKHSTGRVASEEYFKGGIYHREDGPAFISYAEFGIYCEDYYINNKRHREDGPAVIQYNPDGCICLQSYWLNGKLYNEQWQIDNWVDFVKYGKDLEIYQ